MEKVVLNILLGENHMIRKMVLVLGLCILNSSLAYSQVEGTFQIVRAKTINRNLALQFPIEKSFQGTQATFSDAKILIDTLDQSVKLKMTASAGEDQRRLVTTLIFTGDMEYHAFSESYIFDSLQLDSFKVESDTFNNSQSIIKSIKQSLINDFDELVLFNLGEISSFNPTQPADKIEISQGQLRFVWH